MKCEVENLRGKLVEVKKEKDAAKLERKSDKNVHNDLQKKISELAQSIKDLEDEVSENAKSIKVKNAACKKFKSIKEST